MQAPMAPGLLLPLPPLPLPFVAAGAAGSGEGPPAKRRKGGPGSGHYCRSCRHFGEGANPDNGQFGPQVKHGGAPCPNQSAMDDFKQQEGWEKKLKKWDEKYAKQAKQQ